MDLSIFKGLLLGTFTGLIPGIHSNLVAVTIANLNLLNSTIIIFTAALTHTFLNTIPTIHLSSPDPESALSLHPSQEFSQKGKAHEAVLLTLIGSTISLVFLLSLVPLLLKIIKPFYQNFNSSIPFLLLLTALFLIFKQKNKLIALAIFIASGVIGFISLNLNIEQPLTPLFIGLFAIPSLIINTDKNKKKQRITEPTLTKKSLITIKNSLFFGTFFSFLPSVGPAQAATVQSQFTKNKSKGDFLILTGCLNTINILFSVVMLMELNKARNGSIATIKEIGFTDLLALKELFYISLLIVFPCVMICIFSSRIFLKIKNKINAKKLSKLTITFLITITYFLSNFSGIIIVLVSSIIGYLPYKLKTSKTILMGSLMIPTLIYYFSRMF